MPTLDAGWTRRNAPLMIAGLLGILLGVLIMMMLSGGKGDDAAPAAAASPTASASPSKSRTAPPTPVMLPPATASKTAPAPTRTATPTPTPTPEPTTEPTSPVSFEYLRCGRDDNKFFSLEDVWKSTHGHPTDNGCEIVRESAGVPDELQLTALETAYGSADPDNLSNLYRVCTKWGAPESEKTKYVPIDAVHTEEQAKELAGAFLLCPDHPEAERIKSSLALFDGSQVEEGSYLVGTDIQPGTWVSAGEKVTDCYWEVSDAQGNIIDNQFISIAPQITIVIPPEAAGFTASGCSFRLQK